MRPAVICLLSLSFSAALGFGSVQAQSLAADGPITTGPAEVFARAPANVVAPSVPRAPAAPVAPVDLTVPRETVTAATVAAVEAPQAQALATAEQSEAAAEALEEQALATDKKIVELTGDASMSASALAVGGAGGGLLRTNPSLQRPDRRPMGLKFKF